MNKQSLARQSSGKLLVICGPTATGKTSLALKLARKFDGEVLSADSRQVYREMDIGTGKDLPEGAKLKFPWFGKYGYYEIEGIKVWGYDLADPRHEFSIAQYLKFAERIIADIEKRGKLPILVGGTGLYIKGVCKGIPTASVPKNPKLREKYEGKSADELFEIVAQIDSIKAGQMNSSDKKNPRRLIRAIEVATWKIDNVEKEKGIERKERVFDILSIGLIAPMALLEERIERRVADRVGGGIKEEIEKLLRKGVNWGMQSMSGMGYGQWRDYFEGGVEEAPIISEWKRAELSYAKRQMTWFKKDPTIKWFDITAKDYPKNVEKSVEKWHNS
jgi:tRNA dimethylallyltransferase